MPYPSHLTPHSSYLIPHTSFSFHQIIPYLHEMVYHILTGDSLARNFPDAKIQGEIIVSREALIEGDLSGDNLLDFWQSRARFLGIDLDEYRKNVIHEYEKLAGAPDDSEFNLWFEYDLFCQVNMWFTISFINDLSINKKIFAVYTSHLDESDKKFWNGFGSATPGDLRLCFEKRIELNSDEIQLAVDLWQSYKQCDLQSLNQLSLKQSAAFPQIKKVISAHIDRFPANGEKGRPERVMEDIIKNVSRDFNKVCPEFWKRESIYGFGDVQLKHLYDKVMAGR